MLMMSVYLLHVEYLDGVSVDRVVVALVYM